MIFIDSFSGGVAELTKKQRRDGKAVLRVLLVDQMISTWDMDEGDLWRTIEVLTGRGYIKSIPVRYPWLKYEVTEEGKKYLENCKKG